MTEANDAGWQPPLNHPPLAGSPPPQAPAPPGPAQFGAPGAPAPGPAPGAAPAPGPGYTPAPAPPRQPMQPGTKRALIGSLIGVGVLGVLIGGAAIVLAIMNGARDPAAPVAEYLALIADGQAEAATAMVDPGVSKAQAALLTDDVLAGATERIEVISVETVRRDGDGARVTAELELEGERFEHTFSVRHGPKEWLFLDTWELRDPFITEVRLQSYDAAGVRTAFIGDEAVELSLEMDTGIENVYLYPGVYVVSGPTSRYFDSSREAIHLTGANETVTVDVWAEPNDDFETEIMRQAFAAAQSCVTVPSNMNSECPTWLQRSDLTEMRVTQNATRFDSLSTSYFDTDKFTFGRRIAGATSMSTDWYWFNGYIEWDENGEPHIYDYSFYD